MTRNSYILLSFTICLSLAPSALSQYPFDPHLPSIEREGFKPVAHALKGKTLVPAAIPASLPRGDGVGQFFCTVITAERSEYEVIIGTDAGCGGGNACRIGSLSGRRLRGERIRGSRNFPFEQRGAERIRLKGGITGYFVRYTCGANCSDSHIFWRRGGYEYMVGLKVGKKVEVIELANSAIRHSR